MSIKIHLNTTIVIYNQESLNDICKGENGINVIQIRNPWEAEILKLNVLDESFKCLEDKYFALVTDSFKSEYGGSMKLINTYMENQKSCMNQEWYKSLIYTAINIITDPFNFHETIHQSTSHYIDALNTNCNDIVDIYIGIIR